MLFLNPYTARPSVRLEIHNPPCLPRTARLYGSKLPLNLRCSANRNHRTILATSDFLSSILSAIAFLSAVALAEVEATAEALAAEDALRTSDFGFRISDFRLPLACPEPP